MDLSAGLHRRDALWAAALQTAIARRSGDTGALQKHWYAGMEVLAEYSIDLFALLPLGELWVGAARIRQVEQVRHALDQAFTLLESLGKHRYFLRYTTRGLTDEQAAQRTTVSELSLGGLIKRRRKAKAA